MGSVQRILTVNLGSGAAAERATSLARTRGAELIAADTEDPRAVARQAEEHQCDLIVTEAGDIGARIGRGGLIDGLLRHSPLPLLFAGRNAGPYDRTIVAVDFSPVSRVALAAAARLCSRRRLTVFHAYLAAGSYAIADITEFHAQLRRGALAQAATLVAEADLPAELRETVEYHIEYGLPEERIGDALFGVDSPLVVVGTHSRGRVAEVLLGSVSKKLLEVIRCDALVVPTPP